MAGSPIGKPTSTFTFLFTDIQGSTSMWERDARRMQAALARHDEIMHDVVTEHGGHVFKVVGDACYAAFSSAPEALGAAISGQRAIFSEPWDERARVRVRMAFTPERRRSETVTTSAHPSTAWQGSSRPATADRPSSRGQRESGSTVACRRGSPSWDEGRAMTEEQAIALALEIEVNDAKHAEPA